MSDTDTESEEETTESDDLESMTLSDDSDSNDDDDDDDDDEDEDLAKLLDVGALRDAFSDCTNGKNECNLDQFFEILRYLNIDLTTLRATSFFEMLDDEEKAEIGWNQMFYAIKKAQANYSGLPIEDMIGGLLLEFQSTSRFKANENKRRSIQFQQQAFININVKHDSSILPKLEEEKQESKDTNDDIPLMMVACNSQSEVEEADLNDSPTVINERKAKMKKLRNNARLRSSTVANTRLGGSSSTDGTPTAKHISPKARNSYHGRRGRNSDPNIALNHNDIPLKTRFSKNKQVTGAGDKTFGRSNTGMNDSVQYIFDSVQTQEQSLYELYLQISFLEEQIRSKSDTSDLVNALNNIPLLKESIVGISKSTIAQIKSDIFERASLTSAQQVSKEIQSQLSRLHSTMNNANKMISLTSVKQFDDKLISLEKLLQVLSHVGCDNGLPGAMSAASSRPISTREISDPSGQSPFSRPISMRKSRLFGSGFGAHGMQTSLPFDLSTIHMDDNKSVVGDMGSTFGDTTERMSAAVVLDIPHNRKQQSIYTADGMISSAENNKSLMNELSSSKKILTSLEYCLNTNITERLLKLEKSVMSVFGIMSGGGGMSSNMVPISELSNQLKQQKTNFESQEKKQKMQIKELKKLLQHQKQTVIKNKEAAKEERELMIKSLGRFLEQEAVVNQLRFELKKDMSRVIRSTISHRKEIECGTVHNTSVETDEKDEKMDDVITYDKLNTASNAVDIISRTNYDMHDGQLRNSFVNRKYLDEVSEIENKLFTENEKNEIEFLQSILEYPSIDDIPILDKDELPDFMLYNAEDESESESEEDDMSDFEEEKENNRNTRIKKLKKEKKIKERERKLADRKEIVNDRLMEDKLGFGFEDLLRVYRANTNLNLQLQFANNEIKCLKTQLDKNKQPIIYVSAPNTKQVLRLQTNIRSLTDKINYQQRILDNKKLEVKKIAMIDKYRIEMFRDMKKKEHKLWIKLRAEKKRMSFQKRVIKKLFELTKNDAQDVMDEANELKNSVQAEIDIYKEKAHDMECAKAEYELKKSNAVGGGYGSSSSGHILNTKHIDSEVLNEEINKHIEIYKDHLMEEARAEAKEECMEDVERIRQELEKMFDDRFNELMNEIEDERADWQSYEEQFNKERETSESTIANHEQKYLILQAEYQEAKRDRSKMEGKAEQTEQLYKEINEEYEEYKIATEKQLDEFHKTSGSAAVATVTNNAGSNNSSSGGYKSKILSSISSVPRKNMDPTALYAGIYEPSEELEKARHEYKSMKLQQKYEQEQVRILTRDSKSLHKKIGQLDAELKHTNEMLKERDQELLDLQQRSDETVVEKLRPFSKIVEELSHMMKNNAPNTYIFNYKKHEFAQLRSALQEDERDWYVHKNHILRTYFFAIEEWFRDHFWLHERIVQCNKSVKEAMQQVLQDTWLEVRIQTHAFIRWFGNLDYREETELFYTMTVDGEERYFWLQDMYKMINAFRSGVVDSYYSDAIHEREERRESYWQRHPEVFEMYRRQVIRTKERWLNKKELKKIQLKWMEGKKTTTIEADQASEIKAAFFKMKSITGSSSNSMSGSGKSVTERHVSRMDSNKNVMRQSSGLIPTFSSRSNISQK